MNLAGTVLAASVGIATFCNVPSISAQTESDNPIKHEIPTIPEINDSSMQLILNQIRNSYDKFPLLVNSSVRMADGSFDIMYSFSFTKNPKAFDIVAFYNSEQPSIEGDILTAEGLYRIWFDDGNGVYDANDSTYVRVDGKFQRTTTGAELTYILP